MGDIKEINDFEADQHWHDTSRHKNRFDRIRKRIPTAHSSLMKSESNELIDMLDHMDSEEARESKFLLQNTQLNSALPPDYLSFNENITSLDNETNSNLFCQCEHKISTKPIEQMKENTKNLDSLDKINDNTKININIPKH